MTAWRAWTLLAPLVVLVAATPRPLHAQQLVCDAGLVDSLTARGYQRRGDRCEGAFALDHSGDLLRLVSFARRLPAWELLGDEVDRIDFDWARNVTGPVTLLAEVLRRNTYYRMNTVVPADVGRYGWPIDLFASVGIPSEDLGVLATTPMRVGAAVQEVHVAPRVRLDGAGEDCGPFEFTLMPGTSLRRVTWSLHALDSLGRSLGTVIKDRDIDADAYPAFTGIRETIPRQAVTRPGLHRLDVAAVSEGGGAAGPRFLLWLDDGCRR